MKEAEVGIGAAVAGGVALELASEAEGDVEFELVNIAGTEVEGGTGDMAGVEVDVAPDPKSVAGFGLVVSGHDMNHNLSSEVVVAWNPVVVTETRVGSVVVSEPDYMVASYEDTQEDISEVLAGVQLGPTVVEFDLVGKLEHAEIDSFAGCEVVDLGASDGQ